MLFLILFFVVAIWLIRKFIKWLTAPSYIHKVENMYYITGKRELSEKEMQKLKRMRKGKDTGDKILYFILVKAPLYIWIIASVFFILCEFTGGLMLAIWTGIPVISWVLIIRWCFKTGITYKVHSVKKSQKRNK